MRRIELECGEYPFSTPLVLDLTNRAGLDRGEIMFNCRELVTVAAVLFLGDPLPTGLGFLAKRVPILLALSAGFLSPDLASL